LSQSPHCGSNPFLPKSVSNDDFCHKTKSYPTVIPDHWISYKLTSELTFIFIFF
jgi:hypothetical protein